MQANDRFIISAILTGLINRVIWVQPDWLADKAQSVDYMKGMVGIVLPGDGRESGKLCSCHRYPIEKNTFCGYFSADKQIEIPRNACKKLKVYKYIVTSENHFLKAFKTKSLKEKHVILDIDEDYFGVQSGVQLLIDAGIPLDVIYVIDEILPQLFCPNSIMAEQALDKDLRAMFGSLKNKLLLGNTMKSPYAIKPIVSKHVGKHICNKNDNTILRKFVSYINANVTRKIAGALSNAKYCFFDSLQLNHDTKNNLPDFNLCHGTNYPGQTLNQIYVDTETGIEKRGERLSKILDYIFESGAPKIITIARSLRDGYVPRKQQRLVEHTVRKAIETNLSKRFIKSETIFDENLIGGKDGWE